MIYHCKQHANTGKIKRVNIYWKLWEDYVTKSKYILEIMVRLCHKEGVGKYILNSFHFMLEDSICSKLKNLLAKTKLITSLYQYFTYIFTIREVF